MTLLAKLLRRSALALSVAALLPAVLQAQQDDSAQSLKDAFARAYVPRHVQQEEVREATRPQAAPRVARRYKPLNSSQSSSATTPRSIANQDETKPRVTNSAPVADLQIQSEKDLRSPSTPKPIISGAPESVERPAIEFAHEAMGMWWQPLISQALNNGEISQVNPETLVQQALRNSPRILALSQQPLIQETEITRAHAEFDADLFLRSQFDDRVDPVGNSLTTGGLPFLKDNIWYADAGFRRKTYQGSEFEVKQRLGFQNSNSNFFTPQDQGTATLSLNFTQPLMRGRGACYNRSQILIAEIGHSASWDQLASELQDELTKVVEAYWNLYYSRSVLLQKQYNVERGEVILNKLEGRKGLDSLPSQIARARAAVQSRRTELANAFRDVKNSETNIRRLTGSQDAFNANASELIPTQAPTVVQIGKELSGVIEEAMAMRPEVKQAVNRSRIAAAQQQISQHELMPELNLMLNTYVSALRGESEVLESWSDQFAATPGYGVGVEFNVPYARRAAKARNARQRLFLTQVQHEIDQTVQDVVAEAQIAWRQLDSAYQTVVAAAEAIRAARGDLLQNEARWESFALIEGDFAEGQTPTTLLDQLLDAQQRLTNAELTYSQAILEFKTAEIELKRATGVLLNHQEAMSNGDMAPMVEPQMPANSMQR